MDRPQRKSLAAFILVDGIETEDASGGQEITYMVESVQLVSEDEKEKATNTLRHLRLFAMEALTPNSKKRTLETPTEPLRGGTECRRLGRSPTGSAFHVEA